MVRLIALLLIAAFASTAVVGCGETPPASPAKSTK